MKTEIIKGKDISQKQIDFINKSRIKQYGKDINLFSKKQQKDAVFFFVEDDNKIGSLGLLMDIKMNYLGKNYSIRGIGGILSIEKGKGYGKILINAMVDYLEKTGKTGLGFCSEENSKFYEKAGLKTSKNLNLRFEMKNPKTGETEKDPDGGCTGIYYNGKDNLISKVLKTKSIGYYWFPGLNEPHW